MGKHNFNLGTNEYSITKLHYTINYNHKLEHFLYKIDIKESDFKLFLNKIMFKSGLSIKMA